MKFLIFTIFVIIAMVSSEDAKCTPWLQDCQQTSDCCRYLICKTSEAKCVPLKGGIIVPGLDKRPLGPGPYPPNVPKNLLPS